MDYDLEYVIYSNDSDRDGVVDVDDSCPNGNSNWVSTATTDYDDDGCQDAFEDLDDDNDGVLDSIDQCMTADLNLTADIDGDGCDDADEDMDDDNDGVLDSIDQCMTADLNLTADIDGDGCDDADEDSDDDNDGYLDTRELDCLSDPLNATDMPQDMDMDGICDVMDDDTDGDGLFNVIERNTGVYNSIYDTGSDPRNADTDGDGVCDGPISPVTSNCTAGPDAFPLDSSESVDTDNDGTGDNADTDDDGDSVLDADDAFPLDSTKSKDTVSDEDSSIPGFTGILATLSLLGAAFIRRNE